MIEPLAPNQGLGFYHGKEWKFGEDIKYIPDQGPRDISDQKIKTKQTKTQNPTNKKPRLVMREYDVSFQSMDLRARPGLKCLYVLLLNTYGMHSAANLTSEGFHFHKMRLMRVSTFGLWL